MRDISFTFAIVAGFLSFFSPCVLPLVPSYIVYLAGITAEELAQKVSRSRARELTIVNSLLFILGFSLVFILLGAAASLAGQVLYQFRPVIRIAGGLIIIFFGLHVAGLLQLPGLNIERRLHLKARPTDYLGSVLVGATFAAAWTPCAGPILGSILVLAGLTATLKTGVLLLAAYSLGLAVPFFVTALLLNSALFHFKRLEKYLNPIRLASGILLVLAGILVLTGNFEKISSLLIR